MCFGDGLPFPSPTMAGNEASKDRTDGDMEQRAAANFEHSVPAAAGGLESSFRVFESSTWRPTGLTSSPWAGPAVGATELGAGWLRMRTVREDTAHGASVDQELLHAVVIL